MDLQIVFRDDALVVINKPPGLLVHRTRLDVRATEFALQILRDQIGQFVFPIHRLDRPTSGLLVFATSSILAKQVAQQFESRKVFKKYSAIVRGIPSETGSWDEPLQEKLDPTTDAKADSSKPPQSARTDFQRIDSWEIPFSAGKYPHSRYSLVEITPHSGRKHQIRRHFNHMAHPVIGDTTHGDRRHNRVFRNHLGIHRLLLAATELQLEHPIHQMPLELKTGAGEEFELAIQMLNQHSIEFPAL